MNDNGELARDDMQGMTTESWHETTGNDNGELARDDRE